MTQVKLWQITAKTMNAVIVSDGKGSLTTIPNGGVDSVLMLGEDGIPKWVENEALALVISTQAPFGNLTGAANAYTDAQIAALIGGAPIALDTLRELAEKLSGQDDALAALLLQIDQKANSKDVYSRTEMDALLQLKQDQTIDSLKYVIPSAFKAVTPLISCLFGDGSVYNANALQEPGLSIASLHPVTGIYPDAYAVTNVRAVFINGVALHEGWRQPVQNSIFGETLVQFNPELLERLLDDPENNIMILITSDTFSSIFYPDG